MSLGFMRFVLTTCLLVTIDVSAMAQELHSPQINGDRPGPEKCQVDPEGQRGIDQSQVEGEAGIVERCKGVLIPPPTGDTEIIEPAPEVGTTPVIPPDAVPDQPLGPDNP